MTREYRIDIMCSGINSDSDTRSYSKVIAKGRRNLYRFFLVHDTSQYFVGFVSV